MVIFHSYVKLPEGSLHLLQNQVSGILFTLSDRDLFSHPTRILPQTKTQMCLKNEMFWPFQRGECQWIHHGFLRD